MISILITGGTGSFGKAFTKKLLSDEHVQRICILSRDEHKQHDMRTALGENERMRYFVGCVRDRDRLRRAFEGIDIVIHAAALKRIETGAYNPTEMVRTNVGGTINVIEAAHDANVKRVVYLSTDKAFQPISAYGHSKAISESLILAANETSGSNGPTFAVTRYGNVAGSNGSVIPKWRSAKNPTMTDPECTRFWMFMDQATSMVYDVMLDFRLKDVVVPTLPAFRLGDLATAMGIDPEITGLNSFEKKHESMDYGNCSDTARRMSIDELQDALQHV